MPLNYAAGTLAEHRACRTSAVAFDVSHLGTVRVTGADAFERLQRALTNDLRKVAPGRAQYTHLLDENDASVLDDIIVWWIDDERFDVMPNASNTSRVLDALAMGDDVTETRAIIAVQGPDARAALEKFAPEAAETGRFHVAPVTIDGVDCVVAGTGYTGEDGVELAVPAEHAAQIWELVLATGIEPAGLGWVIGWDKDDFRGRVALAAEKERGVSRKLRGITTEGRRPPRAGQEVMIDGQSVGEVTSGNFSPMLEHGIALAFLPPDVEDGTTVRVEARGDSLPGRVVKLPFYRR